MTIRRWAMRKHVAWRLVVISVLVLSANVMLASEEVQIVFPRSVVGVSQHGNVLVVVNYQKNEKNRWVELIWDSIEGEFGSSAVEINSKNNGIPITKDLILSAGEYVFVATLYRSDGSKVVDRQVRFVIQ